jgi:hypothetical protein
MKGMREAKGRGWAGPLAAGAALLLVLAIGVGVWTWRQDRWWRSAPPDGTVLVAFRFPSELIEPDDLAYFVGLIAGGVDRDFAPVITQEGRTFTWLRRLDVRLTVSADRVPDLEAAAAWCFDRWDNTFATDGLLLVRRGEEEILRPFRAYRPP